MSTEVNNQLEETYIPGEEEVAAPSAGMRKTWRFANGKICTGSEDGGTYDTREKIVGALRRIGIHEATYNKDGKDKRVKQLEADIETRDYGVMRVAASLIDMKGKDQPSGVSIALAWNLLQAAKDEVVIFTATQGTKKNEFGSYATFVNMGIYVRGQARPKEAPRRPKVEGETMEIALDKLLAELKSHPAWAARPAHETDDEDGSANTHLSALCKEATANGWPTPEQAPAEWLALYSALYGEAARSSLGEISEDDWGQVRQDVAKWLHDKIAALGEGHHVPVPLKPAVEKLGITKPVAPVATTGGLG